jgi:hypothetical protein
MRFARPLTAVAVATAVAGLGMGLSTPAASAAAPSAAVSPAATFTTPVWGMECTTFTSGSLGSYYGNATCTGLGKWRVNVSCTAGFDYSSLWQHTWPDQTLTARAGSCYWGVSSITVSERTS